MGDLRPGQPSAGRPVDRAPGDRLRDARRPGRRQRRAGLLRGDGRGRQRARRGEGPTLIEAVTYRLGPHTTSDDPTRYRSQEEVDKWAALDPIPRYRNYLQNLGVWTERLEHRVETRAARLCAELRDAIVNTPDMDVGELFDTVYAETTPALQAQRDQLMAELAKEA